MARSSLKPWAPLVVALLFVTDPVFATGVSEDSDLERSHTSTVRTTVGGTAFLMCHLPNIGKMVSWARQRADEVFMTHYRRMSLRFNRVEASCSQQDDVCLLTISNVQKTDSGLYICRVDSTPPIRRFVYLSVSEPETTILGEPFRTHWQGSGINLTCVVQPRRQPEDTVLWMHDDLVIHADHDSRITIITETDTSTISQLLLEDAQPTDSGTYTCKLPDGSSDSVEIEVMQEPKTTILGEPFRTHWQGSGINLTCVVQPRRQPEDTVLWMHDDLVIHADHDSRLTIITETDTSTISQLLLEDAQPNDSGTYTCKLPNGSSDSVEIEVMQVVKDDFHAAMSGGHRPLSAVPPAALVLPVIAAAVGSVCR